MPENTKIRIGFGLCGSFCTLSKAMEQMRQLVVQGYDVTPIMSENTYRTKSNFINYVCIPVIKNCQIGRLTENNK